MINNGKAEGFCTSRNIKGLTEEDTASIIS